MASSRACLMVQAVICVCPALQGLAQKRVAAAWSTIQLTSQLTCGEKHCQRHIETPMPRHAKTINDTTFSPLQYLLSYFLPCFIPLFLPYVCPFSIFFLPFSNVFFPCSSEFLPVYIFSMVFTILFPIGLWCFLCSALFSALFIL